jgi:hypothetical protein
MPPTRAATQPQPKATDVLQGNWARLLRDGHDGIVITPQTATTRWRGERMDYGIAVEWLLHRSKQVPTDVSAETSARSA